MGYKVEFSKTEKNLFNMIERDSVRLSAMAVYALLINNSDRGVCTLSYKRIIDKLKRRYKLSTSMLKRRVDKLIELSLIEVIEKRVSSVKVKYSYKVIRKAEQSIEKATYYNFKNEEDLRVSAKVNINSANNTHQNLSATSLVDGTKSKGIEVINLTDDAEQRIKNKVQDGIKQNIDKTLSKDIKNISSDTHNSNNEECSHIHMKNEKENEKENQKNTSKSIESTGITENNAIINTKTKDIYNNYIKDVEVAKKITREMLTKLKIKKEIIRNTVLARVEEVYKNINIAGANSYIRTLILNTISFYELLSKKNNINISKHKRKTRVKNFAEREISAVEFESMYDDPSIAFM